VLDLLFGSGIIGLFRIGGQFLELIFLSFFPLLVDSFFALFVGIVLLEKELVWFYGCEFTSITFFFFDSNSISGYSFMSL
jgi:hypothetical protein